jgi:hypothetical protein
MNIESCMQQFRLASRELFNQYFRVERASAIGSSEAWDPQERFEVVESVLFDQLVSEPMELPHVPYARPNARIHVQLRGGDFAPIMLNRELESGYWDHPIKEVTREAVLQFISFFDWDQLHYRDNQYVRVLVTGWPSHPELVGKHALIESQYARYAEG